MAGVLGEDGDDEITGINVTPLVDVMLVLLVIFMVTTSYIVKNSIDLKLPKAATAEENKAKTLEFLIDKQQHLYFNSKPIAFEDISGLLAQEKKMQKTDTLTVLISADESVPHGVVVRLIDSVRKNGVQDFAINVETK